MSDGEFTIIDGELRGFKASKSTIKKLVIPDSVHTICNISPLGYSKEYRNPAVTELEIPASVKRIERLDYGFEYDKLKTIIIHSRELVYPPDLFVAFKKVSVYCPKELVSDIKELCCIKNVFPIDDDDDSVDNSNSAVNENEPNKDGNIQFHNYKDLLSFFSDSSLKEGKAKKVVTSVDGVELTVRMKPVSMLERRIEELKDNLCYSLNTAKEYYLDRDDVIDKIHEIDPNDGSDAYMFATPEISCDAPELDDNEKAAYLKAITKIYGLLAQDHILKQLAEIAPKKKNKTYAVNQYTRVACAGLVTPDCSLLEIVGKPASDTVLDIEPKFMRYSPEEREKIKNDYVSTYTNALLGEASAVSGSANKEAKPEKVKKEKTTISIGNEKINVAFRMQDGKPGIDSGLVQAPFIPFDSFSILEGNTKDGYCLKKMGQHVATVHQGGSAHAVTLDLDVASRAIGEAISELAIMRSGRKKYSGREKYEIPSALGIENKKDRFLKTEFIVERWLLSFLVLFEELSSTDFKNLSLSFDESNGHRIPPTISFNDNLSHKIGVNIAFSFSYSELCKTVFNEPIVPEYKCCDNTYIDFGITVAELETRYPQIHDDPKTAGKMLYEIKRDGSLSEKLKAEQILDPEPFYM